jgi:hypothetical protein
MESFHPAGCRVAVRIRGEVLFPASCDAGVRIGARCWSGDCGVAVKERASCSRATQWKAFTSGWKLR